MTTTIFQYPKEAIIRFDLNTITEAESKLENCILKSKFANYNFKRNVTVNQYHFNFYSANLKLGILINNKPNYQENTNQQEIDFLQTPFSEIDILQVSDYQVNIDTDEIIRFMKYNILLS